MDFVTPVTYLRSWVHVRAAGMQPVGLPCVFTVQVDVGAPCNPVRFEVAALVVLAASVDAVAGHRLSLCMSDKQTTPVRARAPLP